MNTFINTVKFVASDLWSPPHNFNKLEKIILAHHMHYEKQTSVSLIKKWKEMKDLEKKHTMDANLVMFPAAKNYPIESEDLIDDPLNDLLNEFSDYEHLHFEDDEDEEEFEDDDNSLSEGTGVFLFERLQTKTTQLEDTTRRMRFLLGELDSFLTKK